MNRIRELFSSTRLFAALNVASGSILVWFWLQFGRHMSGVVISSCPGKWEKVTDQTTDSLQAFLTVQANHYSLLQIYLVIVTIILAILAWWGYTEIEKAAEKKAKQTVTDMLPDLIDRGLRNMTEEKWQQLRSIKTTTPNENNLKTQEEVNKEPFPEDQKL